MTAFNINSGGITSWDSLSGGSVNATLDSYAISAGSTLLIDTDSYQCANHSAAFGSLDTVTFSGIGGTLKIDGTKVRVIPYNTGTGNVPAIGTTISQGGVSGALLGVWANWLSEPTAAAAAMPTTGFIKIKSVTGGAFAAGTLTGIDASATGPDVAGWIEVRGAETATITVPRIGKVEVDGDWFELGTTNGTRGQVLACPTTATVAGVFSAIWIETAAGSGIYERYASVGSLAAASTIPTDVERGKIFWQTTSGIRIGSDGTNNVGYLPPTGCKVRIPNVILTNCIRTAGGSGPRVLPNATLATRQEFVTTSAGDFSIKKAVCQWYAKFTQAYRVLFKDSGISDTLVLSEIAAPLDINNVTIAPTQAQINVALSIAACVGGGTVANTLAVRYSLAASGNYVITNNYNSGITFSDLTGMSLTNRGNATTGVGTFTQLVNCIFTNFKAIGGRLILLSCLNATFTNFSYADNFSGTTGTGNAHYGIDISQGCNNI